ncbi:hypothetical protein ACFLQV_01700 [Calditrichota bacterium]
MGASQCHSINLYEENDHLAVYYSNLIAMSEGDSIRYLCSSVQNASPLQLLSLNLQSLELNFHMNWVIFALVYDDFRENTIVNYPNFDEYEWVNLEEIGGNGIKLLHEELNRKLRNEEQNEESSPVERNATAGTPQEGLESIVVNAMERAMPFFGYRGNLVSRINLFLKSTLAGLFGDIGIRSVPDIPEHLVDRNMYALEALVRINAEQGTKTLIYRQPIRMDKGDFYHDRQKYDKFYEKVDSLVQEYDTAFLIDLEDIIPNLDYWGKTNEGRPDHFHFRDEGHRILADEIHNCIRSLNEAD